MDKTTGAALVALFGFLRYYERLDRHCSKREKVKAAVWSVTTLLTVMFTYKVPEIMPLAVTLVIWATTYGFVDEEKPPALPTAAAAPARLKMATGKVKAAVWSLTTLLTVMFTYKVAEIKPLAVTVVVWAMATTSCGYMLVFYNLWFGPRLIFFPPVNRPSPFRARKFTDDQKIHEIVAQVPWPIEVVHHTWEPSYMGQPMVQIVPGTCVLVACTVCVEAVHRLQHEKLQGKGTTMSPFPFRAAAPDDLLEACHTAGIWKPGVGAHVRDVLNKIREMGGVLATTDAPTRAQRLLPLRSWEEHRWDDFAATALSPGRVADLLYSNGPCIGLVWVSPLYHLYNADRNDEPVYASGFGRSDDARRSEMEEHYPGQVGWHAVVCVGFRNGGRDVLVLDNHTPTGPRRWIHSEEFHALPSVCSACMHLCDRR